jgi:hypothetical protein
MVVLFWPGLLIMLGIAAAIGISHELNERRWKRAREAEEAAKRPAE